MIVYKCSSCAVRVSLCPNGHLADAWCRNFSNIIVLEADFFPNLGIVPFGRVGLGVASMHLLFGLRRGVVLTHVFSQCNIDL